MRRATARPHLDHTGRGQLKQGLAHRRSRYLEARHQFRFVEPGAGRQIAGGDGFLDGFAKPVCKCEPVCHVWTPQETE
jgi:hypothetical protein